MEAMLFTIAEAASIDRQSNNLSIFGVMEEIKAPNFPAIIPRMTVVMMLRRKALENSKQDVRVHVSASNGTQILLDHILPVDFESHYRTRMIFQIQGMAVPTPQPLDISIFHKKSELGSWRVRCTQLETPQVTVIENQPQGRGATRRAARKKAAARKK